MLINAENWQWYYSEDSRVYLDGVLQECAVEAFPEEGWVLRWQKNERGEITTTEPEKVYGNVEIRGTLLTEEPFTGWIEINEQA